MPVNATTSWRKQQAQRISEWREPLKKPKHILTVYTEKCHTAAVLSDPSRKKKTTGKHKQ